MPSNLQVLRQGQRVSDEFLVAHRRDRILGALSVLISEKVYAATSVGDIVKGGGVARKTFYGLFGGKRQAAEALVADRLPSITLPLRSDVERSGLDEFAIDIATGRRHPAAVRLLSKLLDSEPPTASEDLLRSLPPGRHGLDSGFVAANQCRRLLLGFAAAVVTNGFPATTIAHVTDEAHISRRTFYERFSSISDVGYALLAETPRALPGVDVRRGLGALAVEVVAAWYTGQTELAAEWVRIAGDVLDAAAAPADLVEAA